MLKNIKLTALAVSTVAALSIGTAQAQLIDNFTFTQGPISADFGGTLGDNVNPGASAIGTNRQLFIDSAGTAKKIDSDVNSSNPGNFSVANAPLGQGIATLTWTGITGLDQDLTDGGLSDGIVIDVVFIDTGVQVDFKVTDLFAGMSTGSLTFTGGAQETLKFSDFTGSADFTQISNIEMRLTGVPAWDAILNLVQTNRVTPSVPEPGVLALLGIGLLGFAGRAKRKTS